MYVSLANLNHRNTCTCNISVIFSTLLQTVTSCCCVERPPLVCRYRDESGAGRYNDSYDDHHCHLPRPRCRCCWCVRPPARPGTGPASSPGCPPSCPPPPSGSAWRSGSWVPRRPGDQWPHCTAPVSSISWPRSLSCDWAGAGSANLTWTVDGEAVEAAEDSSEVRRIICISIYISSIYKGGQQLPAPGLGRARTEAGWGRLRVVPGRGRGQRGDGGLGQRGAGGHGAGGDHWPGS